MRKLSESADLQPNYNRPEPWGNLSEPGMTFVGNRRQWICNRSGRHHEHQEAVPALTARTRPPPSRLRSRPALALGPLTFARPFDSSEPQIGTCHTSQRPVDHEDLGLGSQLRLPMEVRV